MPFLVTVQKRDFLGLGTRWRIGSGGKLGSPGTEESCLAVDVGKYIQRQQVICSLLICLDELLYKNSMGRSQPECTVHTLSASHTLQ
jgi:hypothetical protein